MSRLPTELNTGRRCFLLSAVGDSSGYYRVAHGTGPIPTETRCPCRTLVTCLGSVSAPGIFLGSFPTHDHFRLRPFFASPRIHANHPQIVWPLHCISHNGLLQLVTYSVCSDNYCFTAGAPWQRRLFAIPGGGSFQAQAVELHCIWAFKLPRARCHQRVSMTMCPQGIPYGTAPCSTVSACTVL